MKKWKRLVLGITATAILSIILIGCGNKDSEDSETASKEKITAENVDNSMDGVTLKIGTSGVFAPFSYYDSDGKTLIGYDIDLINELQTILGFKISNDQLEVMDYAPLTTSVADGKLDVAVAALCATDERKQVMDFTDVYLDSGLKVMINKNSNSGITSVDDLSDKTIAVEKGTASHTYVQKNLPDANVDVYDKITGAYEALEQNKVDALIQDSPNCAFYIKENEDTNLEMVGEEFNKNQSPYAIALVKDSPYASNFNAALKVLKDDGKLDELAQKWTE